MGLLCALASAQTARVVLRWKPVDDARRYQLQIARDDTFKDVVVDTMVESAGFRWDELPNVVYHWRVRSFDKDDRPSQWSPPRAISAAATAPEVRSPAANAVVDCRFDGVDLVVEPQAVFKQYVLRLAEDPAFSGPVQQQENATGRFRVVLAPGTWHWRVHAIDVAGRETESTAARALTVALAAPRQRPAPDVILGQREVSLAWEDVPCAARYQVEASLGDAAAVPLVSSGTGSTFKPQLAGEYRWRVVALDARGAPGAFSPWGTFRVRLPGPRGVADAVGREPVLSWSATAGATGYRVEVSAAPDQKPVVAQAQVEGTSWKPPPQAPGVYLWRVSARDSSGRWSQPSELRRWTVPDPVAPEPPQLVAPFGARVERPDDGKLEVRWEPVANAATYDVQLDTGPVLSKVEPGHTYLAVAPGLHTLRVRARGPGTTPSGWTERTFSFGRAFVARVEVARTRLRLGGPKVSLRVRLLDADGAAVPAGALAVRAQKGKVGEVVWAGDEAVVPYTPPPLSARADAEVLQVTTPGFSQDVTLPLDRGLFSLAANLGGRFNGGAVVSPTIDLGVVFTPGWFSRRLNAEVRVGFYAAGARVELPRGEAVNAAVELVPISFLVAWTQPLFKLDWRLFVGPAFQLAFSQVEQESQFAVVPSLDVGLGVGMPLGPGVIEARLELLYGKLANHVLLEAGGFGVTLGYRIDLPALAH